MHTSVAKGPTFRPQTSKGAAKKGKGPEILAAEFLLDLQKRAEKGPNFFTNLGSGVICGSPEMNTFLTQL
jgi:hypothetical protein